MQLHTRAEPAIVSEDVQFRAGPYLLRGELAYPEASAARGAVVFAGPHPLLGGNMLNNVVRCLGDGLAQRGMITLRFDYRGVGRSDGPHVDVARHMAQFWQTGHAPGEIEFWQDVQGAAEFVQQSAPGLPVIFVGYSFGCVLLPYVRMQPEIAAMVLIAPTVAKHNYDDFRGVTCPTLVIGSDDDFATEAQQLQDWFGTLSMPRELVRQRCDNHFFRGHEEWLNETVMRFLESRGGFDA
jgi:uncharacterized protein